MGMNENNLNKIKKIKIKLKHSQKIKKFGQKLYLCCSNFQNNTLWESASSCSFGFIFSFIPLVLIILTILTGIFRISPGIINYTLKFADTIQSIVNITPFIQTILNMKTFHVIDIVLAFWIIWMARKLFISIMQAMTKIFRSVSKRKNILNQLFVFLLEFLIVVIIAAVIIFSFVMNQLVTSSSFDQIREFFPKIVNENSHHIVTLIMYFVIFICTIFVYRIMAGTKPPVLLCIFYAALSVLAFFLISLLINKFTNFTKYNVVYGTISSFVILMMRVYFFFIFFLFFAQMIYVSQFFDTLLLSEIYLLPTIETKGLMPSFRRMMFVNPAALKTTVNSKFYKAGDLIFSKGDSAEQIYYIRKGKIMEETEASPVFHESGEFVVEAQCILNQPRIGNCLAVQDSKLLVFSKDEFMDLMQKSPKAASKAISKISEETATIYNA